MWRALLDPDSLKAVIPGCHELRKTGDNDYVAEVSLGVGPVRGRFTATVSLSELVTEKSGRIGGALAGPLGSASGSGLLRLSPSPAGTRIDYDYAVAIGGKVAAVGGRLLDGATAVIIRQFFERLGRRLAGAVGGRLRQALPVAPPVRRSGGAMKPRRFDYARPDSVAEALALLAEHGEDAKVLAGGQSLMAMLNLRLLEPAVLIDIARLAELDTIKMAGDKVEVGAAVTQNRLQDWPELAAKLPLLAKALPFVGHFQTRNKGTVCGSVAHADPSSEIPLTLATLGGEVVLRSRRGMRTVAAADFQRGMLTTAREPDELITAVRFPVQSERRVAFREVARRHGDFAIIAVAASVESAVATAKGAAVVRVGIGGVADRPAVRRIVIDGAGAAKAAFEALAWELEGYDDIHASARLRRDLLRRVGPAVVEEALQCAA